MPQSAQRKASSESIVYHAQPTVNVRDTLTAALPWSPVRNDGTYQNPVLFADYSDPDVIRVGDDYWLTSSSFNHVPGLPILHSRDLVTWSLVNHALPRLVPDVHFSQPRHGDGVWAPAIRFHQGRYRLYFPDPDFGIQVISAEDPRGEWTEPTMVKAGKGLIDPCPFWDDDGTGYLVHGWAKSRSGKKNRITLHRLRTDHAGVTDAGEVIIDGDRLTGWHTLEGPKLYKRGGYYYVFAPAGGVRDGFQAVFRARNLRGPYEHRIVLAQGQSEVNGPHQGAWVDTPEGDHWFLHFQEIPAFGRVVHLQPMQWCDDWPVIGKGGGEDEPGEPVVSHGRPRIHHSSGEALAISDRFEGDTLPRQWQWQSNPQPDWFEAGGERPGLRLICVRQSDAATLWQAGHLLLQKFAGPAFVATTELRFFPSEDGNRCGLVVFGFDYAWIGLIRERGRSNLVLRVCESAHQSGVERELARASTDDGPIQFRVTVDVNAVCRFYYCIDGRHFLLCGVPFQARSSFWVGAKIGLFSSAVSGSSETNDSVYGHCDVNWFKVEASNV